MKESPLAFDYGSVGKISPAAQAQRSPAAEAVLDVAFGSVAGMIGKIIEYPFDTVKVRLQSQPDGQPLRYAGPLDCARQALREGGVGSLYRGISAPLVGAAIENGSLFVTYRLAQDGLRRWLVGSSSIESKASGSDALPLSALVLCGAISGGATSLVLTPIELVKCQMQAPQGVAPNAAKPLPSPLAVIAAVWQAHGIRGFWRGQLGTLIRETGGSAAWFGSYEGVCAFLRKPPLHLKDLESAVEHPELSVWKQLFAGAVAGVSYNFICYPADTIKSRMQTEVALPGNHTSDFQRPTFAMVGRSLWREQGLRGMYRGCGITVARAAPSSAVIFAVYESLKSAFD